MQRPWIDAGAAAALERGERLQIELDGDLVAVVTVGGEFYAYEDRCTHDGEALHGAELELEASGRAVVICPRHGARFCLRDGEALTPPAYEPVRVYETRVRDGRVEVRAP
jgi:3-phenylpropionate/trans-cinnamate dioxygenase ferredoxin subunit